MPSCWTLGPGAAWSVEAGEHTGFHLSANTAKKEGIQVDSPTVDFSHMTTATIIGSGFNGLSAAIRRRRERYKGLGADQPHRRSMRDSRD